MLRGDRSLENRTSIPRSRIVNWAIQKKGVEVPPKANTEIHIATPSPASAIRSTTFSDPVSACLRFRENILKIILQWLFPGEARGGAVRWVVIVTTSREIHPVQYNSDEICTYTANAALRLQRLFPGYGSAFYNQEHAAHYRSKDAAVGQGQHGRRVNSHKVVSLLRRLEQG